MRRALFQAGIALAFAATVLASLPLGGRSALAPEIAEAVANGQPGPSGKVAFVRDGQIFVANPDGSYLAQLTSEGNNVDPHWSPDGTQIVFASNRDNDKMPIDESRTLWHLYLMNADGSNQRLITPRNQNAFSGVFTPDGGYIVFIRDYGFSGKVPPPPAQGQPPKGQQPPPQGQQQPPRPGQPPAQGQQPPQGQQQPPPQAQQPPFSFTNAISLLNIADNGIDNIAATEQPKDAPFIYARVSPDGQTILYQVFTPLGGRGIEVINSDGSNRRTIYYEDGNLVPFMYNPYFFGDGSRILYSVRWFNKDQFQQQPQQGQQPAPIQPVRTAVEVVAVDGSSRQPLFDAPTELQAAVPSGDGQFLMMSLGRQGEGQSQVIDELFLYRSDGTQLQKIADGYMPAWQK